MWLGNESFSRLAERANREGVAALAADNKTKRVGAAPTAVGQDQERWRYRNCPVCACHMQRRNYGRLSGVIIDLCREHGVWFDADELPRILAWIRQGGLDEARRMRAAESAEAERRERLMRAGDKTTQSQTTLGDLNDDRQHDSMQEVVIEVLTRLFLR